MIADYSMNLFFSRTMRLALIFLASIFLCLVPIERTLSQELSTATKKLFEAISIGDLAQVKISIADGADYNAINTWGITPVDLAVDKGHIKIMHYLLHVIEMVLPGSRHPNTSPGDSAGRNVVTPRSKIRGNGNLHLNVCSRQLVFIRDGITFTVEDGLAQLPRIEDDALR